MVGPASRWTFRFTPTSASRLNAVEGIFAKLARRRLKRGVFRSVDDLKAAIDRFVTETTPIQSPCLDGQSQTRPRRYQTGEASIH
jgi:transposase